MGQIVTLLLIGILPIAAALNIGTDDTLEKRYYFLCFAVLAALSVLRSPSGAATLIVSPTCLVSLYVSLSLFFGMYAYEINEGLYLASNLGRTPNLRSIIYGSDVVAYTLVCLSAMFILTYSIRDEAGLYISRRAVENDGREVRQSRHGSIKISLFVLYAIHFLSLAVGVLFPNIAVISSIFAMASYFLAGALLPILLRNRSVLFRGAIYVAIVLFFASTTFDNKRESVGLIFIVLTVELSLRWHVWRDYKFLGAILLSLAPVAFVIFVSFLSILRGYGGFEINGIGDAVTAIPKYVQSRGFFSNIMDNTEAPIFTAMHFRSIDAGLYGQIPPLLGSTYLKAIFLPFPEWIVGEKPKSMVAIWTNLVSPGIYERGLSTPISFIAEAFLNFRILGVFAVVTFAVAAELAFLRFLRSLRDFDVGRASFWVFVVSNFFFFARGSGLEILVLNCGAAIVCVAIIKFFRLA